MVLVRTAAWESDVHAASNQLCDLRRVLGATSHTHKVGERRERRDKPGRDKKIVVTPSASTQMLEAMRKSGLVESLLQDKIAALTLQLKESRQANHRKKAKLAEMQAHCESCWGCAITRVWKRLKNWVMLRGSLLEEMNK